MKEGAGAGGDDVTAAGLRLSLGGDDADVAAERLAVKAGQGDEQAMVRGPAALLFVSWQTAS
jgi:hypothetical protein